MANGSFRTWSTSQTKVHWFPFPLTDRARELVVCEHAAEGPGFAGHYKVAVKGTETALRAVKLWHREFERSNSRRIHLGLKGSWEWGDTNWVPHGTAEKKSLRGNQVSIAFYVYARGWDLERLLPQRSLEQCLSLSQLTYLEMRDVIAELGLRP